MDDGVHALARACVGSARTEGCWRQLDIGLVRERGDARGSARALFAAALPLLEAGHSSGAVPRWFFMRKPPDVRLRIEQTDEGHAFENLREAMVELLSHGRIRELTEGRYRPEIARFGGLRALSVVHGYFCADSWLWSVRDQRGGPAGTDTELLWVFQDLFECAGVAEFAWPVLAHLTDPERTHRAFDTNADGPRPGADAERARAPLKNAWLDAYRQVNHALVEHLNQLRTDEELDKPVADLLATVALFSFNRHGYPGSRSGPLVAAVMRQRARGEPISSIDGSQRS